MKCDSFEQQKSAFCSNVGDQTGVWTPQDVNNMTTPDFGTSRLSVSQDEVLLRRVPGITPDDLDELGYLMEVTVDSKIGMQEPAVTKHVRGCAELLAGRLSKLHGLLKQR